MSIDPKIEEQIQRALLLESAGRYDDAEAALNQAAAAANSDRLLAGTLHINLGNVARSAGRLDDAIGYYQKAADLLAGLKGEALLQRGYAFLNMADLMLQKDDPNAIGAAAEAVRMHRTYPFVSPTDLADAVALNILARMFLGGTLSERELHAAWTDIKAAPCASLMQHVMFDFVTNYLCVVKQSDPQRYAATLAEIKEWALPDLYAEIAALLEQGPNHLQAVKLHHRLQRALLGLADPARPSR